MNRSLKSVLALVILVSLVACAMGWTVGGIEGVPSSRFWMRVSGLLAVGALILLLRAEFRQDLAPDFLRRGVKAYFEQNGLCFAVLPSVENNHFAWQILFQNRFERACRSTIAFRPAAPTFGFRKPTLSGVKVEIDCPGGAFGFVSIPYQVESEYQTKQVQFELIASTTFPDGKGKMLRFRDGLAVGKRHKSGVDLAITTLSVLALHPHFTHSARFKVRMPQSLSSETIGEPSQMIIWRPGDSIPA